MNDYQQLVNALYGLLQSIQPKIPYRPALLGDGYGTIVVADRPGFSYVRLMADGAKTMQVFGVKVNGYDGMPVIVGELPWMPNITQILDVDWSAFLNITVDGWPTNTTYINATPTQHGSTHNSLGSDPADIDKQNIRELRLGWGTGNWDVAIFPDFYPYNETHQYFAGTNFDLTPFVTGSLVNGGIATGVPHYTTLYIDPILNDVGAMNGPMLTGQTYFGVNGDIVPFFPVLPRGVVPIATLYIDGLNQTHVNLTGIFTNRLMWQQIGNITAFGTGTPLPANVYTGTYRGFSEYPARSDHVHQGVHAINGLYGNITLQGGTGVALTTVGQTITVNVTGSLGGGGGGAGSLGIVKDGRVTLTGTTQLLFSTGTVVDYGGGVARIRNYWEPLTNGSPTGTEFIFSNGDIVMAGY